ncbi:MAG TPA: uroporphyrinogen decarboxylase family protein [Phycisphaerae bacterium]|nr:uroporphyrinogen decarboxylase family protein [Phycisphaerae bacterium]
MTSRERLLTALRRGTPDRVPVTIYEHAPLGDGWANVEPSYAPMLDLERQYGDSFVRAPIDVPVLLGDPNSVRGQDETSADGSLVKTNIIDTPKGQLRWVTRRDPSQMTWWQIEPLIKSDEDIERVLSMPDGPNTVDADKLKTLEQKVGEDGILLFSLGDAIGHVVGLFDFEDFIMRAYTDDGPIRALLAKAQTQVMRAIQAIGSVVKDTAIRLWGPEYCGAPLMSPQVYFPKYVLDLDKPATDLIHATGNFSVIHCHGRLDAILELIADIGADALEPIETLPMSTADVTLADVKRRIGHRMCLMGAVQSLTLEQGTPERVRQEIREAIEAGAPGGGFVLLPTSAPFSIPLPDNVLANIKSMYQAAHEFGRYKD